MYIEKMMFAKKWKDEIFNSDDFNDWVNENPLEAYNILMEITSSIENKNSQKELFDICDILRFKYKWSNPDHLKGIEDIIAATKEYYGIK